MTPEYEWEDFLCLTPGRKINVLMRIIATGSTASTAPEILYWLREIGVIMPEGLYDIDRAEQELRFLYGQKV